MMSEPELQAERPFVAERLPWVVAGAALVVFLLTLNRWVSLNSIGAVARLSGWLWQPELNTPLYWLVTAPLRWLPAPAIPVALNVFSALCAALTLALMARSVALLPHDRTQAQRLREKDPSGRLTIAASWLPPVAAVVLCGLQLTFWENATVASSEMLDLLVFAYSIRCLLEYRLEEDVSWLTRASFVYALGMASNWAMVGFFPLFIAALIWSRGLSFFNLQFLTRMFLWGVAGLLLYLLLPLLQSRADVSPVPFWAGLKAILGGQKLILWTLYQTSKQMVLLLSLTSLVPLLVMSLRWPSRFGDKSQLGADLASLTFHVVHGLFFIACVWVALDPPFSPRNRGLGLPFLTFYYLSALCAGYFTGYFLLVFGTSPAGRFVRPPPPWQQLLNRAVILAACLVLLLAPATLLYRNLPQIKVSNGRMLRQFATLSSQELPSKGCAVLSDDLRRLLLCQSAATQDGLSQDRLFIDTSSLVWPEYHRFLHQKYRERWPVDPPKGQTTKIEGGPLVGLISKLIQTNAMYYLHPSFGYYFEAFYLESHGLVYQLKPYATNRLTASPPSTELVEANEAFWSNAAASVLPSLLSALPPPRDARPQGLLPTLLHKAHLEPMGNRDAALLAAYYSRALDYWGVEMQQLRRLTNAEAHFELARRLNPENVPAEINLLCNRNLQAGRSASVQLSKSIEDDFSRFHNWDQLIGENGPVDEPGFCYQQGRVFASGGNYRQAALEFARVRTLAPENLAARLWLAQLHILGRMPAEAIRIVGEIYGDAELLKLDRTNRVELAFVETSAHLANQDLAGAETASQAAIQKYPGDTNYLAVCAQAFMNYGYYTNALTLLEKQLRLNPDDPGALVNQGYAFMQLNAYDSAIGPLSHALTIDKNNFSARLNRAIAYLRTDQLDKAQQDYETLRQIAPNLYQAYFGLGEIAYRKKDTNAALVNYQLYLSNAPPNLPEAQQVRDRIHELRPGSR